MSNDYERKYYIHNYVFVVFSNILKKLSWLVDTQIDYMYISECENVWLWSGQVNQS